MIFYAQTELTPERLERYLVVLRDIHTGPAAAKAVTAVRRFATLLQHGDLVRAAMDQADPVAALCSMAADIEAACRQILETRASAEEAVRADSVERRRLDAAAATLMFAAREGLAKIAAASDAAAKDRERRLSAAGLSEDEIEAIVEARDARAEPDGAELKARAEALEGYLACPLRDRTKLSPDLLADLESFKPLQIEIPRHRREVVEDSTSQRISALEALVANRASLNRVEP